MFHRPFPLLTRLQRPQEDRYASQRRAFHISNKRDALPVIIWPLLGFLKVSRG